MSTTSPTDRSAEFSRAATMTGTRVALEPLSLEHAEGLQAVVAEGDLHRTWYTHVPAPDAVEAEIERRLTLQARGEMAPWAVRRLDTGAVCGATTFMALRPGVPKLEIGSTFYAKSAQRSGINTETKFLLLTRAFEELHCIAVELRTHWHNHQSRTAIARLGARQDGVLRNDVVWDDGSYRDTVVFSILESEWPAVRSDLRYRTQR